MSDRYFVFTLDGIEVANPKDWDGAKIVIERDSTFNWLFVNYIQKLTFYGDGYQYILSQIDANSFCGTIDFEVTEYENGGRLTDGIYYTGIIDLSNVTINRSQCYAEVSIEDNSLAWLIKKYKDTKIVINAQSKTLNNEVLAKIGTTITKSPSIAYVPGTTTIAAAYYSDSFQYLLNYITDNRMTLSSNLLQVDEWNPYYGQLAFSSLAGGQTSTVTYKNIYGETITWSTSGVKTATQHRNAFWLDNIYNLVSDGATQQETLSELVYIYPTSSDVLDISTLWDPEFTFNGYVIENIIDSYSDGAANIAYTTPFNIQAVNGIFPTQGYYGELSIYDLFSEIKKTWNAEMTIRKVNGVNTCIVEKLSNILNNLLLTATLDNVDSIEETLADDLIYKSFKYSQASSNEPFYIFKKAEYTFNNCGLKNYDCNLQFYYGLYAHNQITSASLTDISILPFRVYPTTTEVGIVFSEYNNTNTSYKYAIGEFASHPVVVRRHLEVVNTTATCGGKTMVNENDFQLKRLNKFTYPLCWTDMRTMISTPDGYINFNYTTDINDQKRGYIKKVEYEVLTGKTKFELYSA